MNNISIEFRENVKYPVKENIIFPNKQYSELPFKYERIEKHNIIFEMVRESFKNLQLDKKNINKKIWNPLGDNLIKQGNTVLIKPNLVSEKNKSDNGEECLYTNPSVVAAVIPYVWKALNGKGKIIIADAPVQSCNFEQLVEISGYNDLVNYYKELNVNIELKDLRGLISKNEKGIMKQNISLQNKNGLVIDLGKESEHAKLSKSELQKNRITNYNPKELLKHHNEQKHEYFIAKEVLDADVIINMPKPKAHRKAGVTIAMKNFVGINTRKEYLPHHRFGDIFNGGDEYKEKSVLLRISSRLLDKANIASSIGHYTFYKILKNTSKLISKIDRKIFSKEQNREGSWYGNDTIWRTIIDLNKIVKYVDKNGKMQNKPQRKIFIIADMIVIGEKEGPLMPSPKYAGIIGMGEDLVSFDEIISSILGLDIKKIPLFNYARKKRKYAIDNNKYGKIISNVEKFNNKTLETITKEISINIEPSSGWKNHIEL